MGGVVIEYWRGFCWRRSYLILEQELDPSLYEWARRYYGP